MKVIAIFSLVTLSLSSFFTRAEAASAPNGCHPVVAAVKETARPADHSSVVAGGRSDGSNADTNLGCHATKASKRTLARASHRFHQITTLASGKLNRAASPINVSFSEFNTRYQDAMAIPGTPPVEGRQNAALATTQVRTNTNITHINSSIAALATAPTLSAAAVHCNAVKTVARSMITLLRRDLVDVEATKLIAHGDKQAGNELFIRGRKIVYGTSVVCPKDLVSMAHSQKVAFHSQTEAQVNEQYQGAVTPNI